MDTVVDPVKLDVRSEVSWVAQLRRLVVVVLRVAHLRVHRAEVVL